MKTVAGQVLNDHNFPVLQAIEVKQVLLNFFFILFPMIPNFVGFGEKMQKVPENAGGGPAKCQEKARALAWFRVWASLMGKKGGPQ